MGDIVYTIACDPTMEWIQEIADSPAIIGNTREILTIIDVVNPGTRRLYIINNVLSFIRRGLVE